MLGDGRRAASWGVLKLAAVHMVRAVCYMESTHTGSVSLIASTHSGPQIEPRWSKRGRVKKKKAADGKDAGRAARSHRVYMVRTRDQLSVSALSARTCAWPMLATSQHEQMFSPSSSFCLPRRPARHSH